MRQVSVSGLYAPGRVLDSYPWSMLAKLFTLCIVVLALSCSIAEASGWVVKKATGKVYLVAPGVKAFRAKTGMALEPGYTVATKGRARALIARGAETIFVGPNTKFALSKYRSTGGKTTLLQTAGRLQVDVQKRAQPHFTVETPYMAAVVKGTKFNVVVDGVSARVEVERGLVQVDDFASGDRANVGAGQSASTNPTRSVGLQVGGRTKPQVVRGQKKAPVFETPAVKNVPRAVPGKSRQVERANRGGVLGAIFGGGNSNARGNGNGGGNSNAGGNGNGNGGGNSNAGGNGNGNGGGNSNAGGNGNGNGGGNSNAGGNGNGNGGGNSNAGGNGNGNGGGNSNAGGNGNGNGGGNSNAGGNGNGGGNSNAGGNGNGGGNGKGNGKK